MPKRVNRLTGLKTVFGFGPQIAASVEAQPAGLLLHEQIIYSLFPPDIGMRQYWRDMDSLLAWTRSDPHREWWKRFLRDSGGAGFWHEFAKEKRAQGASLNDIDKEVREPSGERLGSARLQPSAAIACSSCVTSRSS